MQKNINFFLVLGVPTFGEGGGAWLGKNPKFFQKIHLKDPLRETLPIILHPRLSISVAGGGGQMLKEEEVVGKKMAQLIFS